MPSINEPSVTLTPENVLQDRKYLKNTTPKTPSWYSSVFKAFQGCVTQQDYEGRIVELRERGISPVSCNSWILGINAYLRWSNAGFKLSRLKTEKKILATFSQEQITKLLAYKTKSKTMQRAQVLAGLLLVTGLRIAEAPSLRGSDVDLDHFLITVMGKGRKMLRCPISPEGRRRLYLHLRQGSPDDYVFGTKTGTALSIRNAQHDLMALCRRCGISGVRCSPHTMRHHFAINYLRGGGDLFYLSKILGHSSIQITQAYLQSVQPEDLQARHISPLEPRGSNNR